MRLGLLNKARATLANAKKLALKIGSLSPSLNKNLEAFAAHVAHAKSIGHNFDEMYEKIEPGLSYPEGDDYASDDYYGDDGDADAYGDGGSANTAGTSSGTFSSGISNQPSAKSTLKVVVDLSYSLGVGLNQDVVVDNVKDGGQFDTAGVKPGDEVVAVGARSVTILDDFKEAIQAHKERSAASVELTIATSRSMTPKEAEKQQQASKADEEKAMSITIDAVQLVMKGDHSRALKLFERAAKLDPTNASVRCFPFLHSKSKLYTPQLMSPSRAFVCGVAGGHVGERRQRSARLGYDG